MQFENIQQIEYECINNQAYGFFFSDDIFSKNNPKEVLQNIYQSNENSVIAEQVQEDDVLYEIIQEYFQSKHTQRNLSPKNTTGIQFTSQLDIETLNIQQLETNVETQRIKNQYKNCIFNTKQPNTNNNLRLNESLYSPQIKSFDIKYLNIYLQKIPSTQFQDQSYDYLMINFEDITDKIQNKNQSIISSYKDNILALVSHDFKNPLSSISLMLEKALTTYDIEELHENVILCQKTSNYLQYLVDDIQDYSQIMRSKLRLVIQKANIVDIIKDVFELFQQQAILKGVILQVQMEIDQSRYSINTDTNRLKQVLVNLISNALKFTFKQGVITLKVEQQNLYNNCLKIQVVDNGVGMPEHVKNNLFQLFSTFNHHGNSNNKGVGLGLYICKKIVGLLGPQKEINVKSQLKVGSTFTFYIYQNLDTFQSNNNITLQQSTIFPKSQKSGNLNRRFSNYQQTKTDFKQKKMSNLNLDNSYQKKLSLVIENQKSSINDSLNSKLNEFNKINATYTEFDISNNQNNIQIEKEEKLKNSTQIQKKRKNKKKTTINLVPKIVTIEASTLQFGINDFQTSFRVIENRQNSILSPNQQNSYSNNVLTSLQSNNNTNIDNSNNDNNQDNIQNNNEQLNVNKNNNDNDDDNNNLVNISNNSNKQLFNIEKKFNHIEPIKSINNINFSDLNSPPQLLPNNKIQQNNLIKNNTQQGLQSQVSNCMLELSTQLQTLKRGKIQQKDDIITKIKSVIKNQINLLVVDDQLFNVLAFKMNFNKIDNFHIYEAYNGEQAIQLIQEKSKENLKFDLIFMDLQMPVMDGLQCTKIIRKLEEYKDFNCNIIGCTGNSDENTMEECYQVGMDAVIQKPLNLNTFYLTIKDLFDEQNYENESFKEENTEEED